jgi:diacylglycerol kinase
MEQSPGVGKLHGLGLCFGYFVNTCMAGPSEKDVSPSLSLSLSLSLLFIVELLNSLIESHAILITAFYFRGLNAHAYKMIKL